MAENTPAAASHVVDVGLGGVVVCLDQQDLVLELMGCRLQSEVNSRQLPPVGAVPRLPLAEEASGLIGWAGTPAHWLPPTSPSEMRCICGHDELMLLGND